ALQLSGVNTYTGTTTVAAGSTLMPVDQNSLGATTGGTIGDVVVQNGGTLDLRNLVAANNVSTVSFGNKHFIIAGAGVGGAGAIAHSGGNAATNVLHFVQLSDDATINTSQRINIGDSTLSGTLDLAGHTLTKIGGNNLYLTNTTVTDGNIAVTDTGRLQLEGTTQIPAGSGTSISFNTAGSSLGLN